MARRGSFGGTLYPFGTGSLGSLSQYDIAGDLANLDVYKTEVAWGNGQATDQDYLDALRRAVAATDPTTQAGVSAQNKLDDAVYRIGRSQAGENLDALIAFDQAAISQMNTDNLRFRDVNDSLQAELAQRRSRDYGLLVTAYNAGQVSTQTLLDWVNTTLGAISPDSPDHANWTNVQGDLGDRLVSEKDTQVYQDFQRGRMSPADFLTYITSRRDSYDPSSPKYQEWANKVEDATAQIKDAAQAKADSAFFAAYNEGKKSDASYLTYLRRRIDGMKPDDPQKGEWQYRLNQAVFSLTEDKLRFDAEKATQKVNGAKQPSASAIRAAKSSMGKLMDFYTSYRSTLNPGSAEWRTVTRSIDSLAKNQAALTTQTSPARGTGSSTRSSSSAGTGSPTAALVGGGKATTTSGTLGDKLIGPKYTLSNILGVFAINPAGKKKDIAAAKKYLDLNTSTLKNALQRGDDVWLFADPRFPTAITAGRNPDGSPMLDKNGNPVMVRGATYLPVKSETFSNLKTVQASNLQSAAEFALSNGKFGDYASLTRQAGDALDAARLQDGQYRAQNWQDWYDATKKAVDKATQAGDYGTALKMSTDLAVRLAREAKNPYLDDTRRAQLNGLGEQLAANPIMPKANADGSIQSEGAVNLGELQRGNVSLNPGWHHVLKSNTRGQPDWGPVFDPKQDGSWEAKHVTVHTSLGEKLVTGEVERRNAQLNPQMLVRTPEGYRMIAAPSSTEEISFVDERGLVQRAYSLDGQTWIRPGPGMPAPTIEITAPLVAQKDPKGRVLYVDANSGDTVFTQNDSGGFDITAAYFNANPAAKSWYGQAAWEAARSQPAGHQASMYSPISGREAFRPNIVTALSMDVGGPGQHMTLANTSGTGVVNLLPPNWQSADEIAADKRESNRLSQVTRLAASSGRGGAGAWGAPSDTRQELLDEQAFRRRLARRPVTSADLSRQLPSDTPPRYEGGGRPAQPSPTLAARPGSALPALTPPPRTAPPVVNAQTGFSTPALKTATPASLSATPAKTSLPPPPRTTVGGGPKSVASKTGAPVKPPAPPAVRTPTATPGVYRPASVAASGHGPTQ